MTQSKIVILEADQYRRDYIRSIVSDGDCIPYIFENETICLDNLLPLDPDLVISGLLSNDRMFRFVNTVKMIDSSLPVLILSGDHSVRESATWNGFADVKVIEVDFRPSEINGAICNLLKNRNSNTGNRDADSPMIVGNSSEILKIKKSILDLKDSRETVLIQGEPGTGKELVARALHHHSGSCSQPFVKVNLAELKSPTLDKTFFDSSQCGPSNSEPNARAMLYGSAGGTIFLDEIQALSSDHQARLLTIFEDGYSQPDPSDSRETDPQKGRIIVSSNIRLGQRVRQGNFRRDLFYRLNVMSMVVPPLRERANDIPMLSDFFADQFCMELGVGHINLSKRIKDIFCSYHWPGNVRELKNMTRRAILQGDKDNLIVNLARQWTQNKKFINCYTDGDMSTGIGGLKKKLKNLDNLSLKHICNDFLVNTERKIITKALEQTNWNRKQAAGLLDISYKSLLNKIKEYKLRKSV